MDRVLELPESPPAALLDGAIALALSTGVPLALSARLSGVDAELLVAAAQLSGDAAAAEARAALGRGAPQHALARPKAGKYSLLLREPGAVARAATAFAWPLALAGRGSELQLRGPNHTQGAPTFHALRLGWAPLAAAFGLRVSLELRAAAFAGDAPEQGELRLSLDPSPALTPLRLVHRGLLQKATLLTASCSGAHAEALAAAEEAQRRLRLHGVHAEPERVPLPGASAQQQGGAAHRWALTAVAEFEHAVVAVSGLPRGDEQGGTVAAAARVSDALSAFLSSRGALDGEAAERALVPAILCAAGLGARAGPPPKCHFTTTEVTPALVALAALAHTVLPVRAVIDGAAGEEGVVVVAPNT